MGPRPSLQHTIDRIDNDMHYSCGHCEECLANCRTANCRWATRKEQSWNQAKTLMVTAFGKTQNLFAWSEETGKPVVLLYQRIVTYRMTPEEAMTVARHQRKFAEHVHQLSDEAITSAAELYGSGESLRAAAKSIGTTAKALRGAFSRRGVAIRKGKAADRIVITAFGQSLNPHQWEAIRGVPAATIIWRIKHGWTPERAVSEPPRTAEMLTAHGLTMDKFAWAEHLGVTYQCLDLRFAKGESLEQALTPRRRKKST